MNKFSIYQIINKSKFNINNNYQKKLKLNNRKSKLNLNKSYNRN